MEEIKVQLKQTIIEVLEDISMMADQIGDDSVLVECGLNSLYFVKLVVRLEEKLHIEFDDDYLDIKKFKTFHDLADYVLKKVSN